MQDDWDDSPHHEEPVRDQEIDRASISVLKIFFENPRRVFYSTEIETHLEREHFHWITAKALRELSASGQIQSQTKEVQRKHVNFYMDRSYRYYSRELQRKAEILSRIYESDFTQAVGRTAELLFDSAFAQNEFVIKGRDVNAWEGKAWLETNLNLDRIVARDGVLYGVEIKNTQNYINKFELETKLELCRHLGLRPLFIFRWAPKTYIHMVHSKGGFSLLFEEQLYPLGYKSLLTEVRPALGLKVQIANAIKQGDMARLVNWHVKKLGR